MAGIARTPFAFASPVSNMPGPGVRQGKLAPSAFVDVYFRVMYDDAVEVSVHGVHGWSAEPVRLARGADGVWCGSTSMTPGATFECKLAAEIPLGQTQQTMSRWEGPDGPAGNRLLNVPRVHTGQQVVFDLRWEDREGTVVTTPTVCPVCLRDEAIPGVHWVCGLLCVLAQGTPMSAPTSGTHPLSDDGFSKHGRGSAPGSPPRRTIAFGDDPHGVEASPPRSGPRHHAPSSTAIVLRDPRNAPPMDGNWLRWIALALHGLLFNQDPLASSPSGPRM